MKILFALLLFALGIFAASSPVYAQQTMTLSASADTLTDSETGYATLQVLTPVDVLTIQYVSTRVSGTAAGTALPQGSIDGINYVDISTDTLTYTNAVTNTKIWTFTKAPYKYYRVKAVNTGTHVSIPSAKMFTRQPPK